MGRAAAHKDARRLCLARPQVPGVVGFFCHKDVPGSNAIGPVWLDEEVFASSEVTAVGQVRRQKACSDEWERRIRA